MGQTYSKANIKVTVKLGLSVNHYSHKIKLAKEILKYILTSYI